MKIDLTNELLSYGKIKTILEAGEFVGDELTKRGRENNYRTRWGQDKKNTPKDNRVGKIAEATGAWHFGFEYSPERGSDISDVGGAEFKGTPYSNGLLLCNPDDLKKPGILERIWILVTVDRDVSATIRGWCYGSELVKDENWGDHCRTGRPCYALPQRLLHNINRLERRGDLITVASHTDEYQPRHGVNLCP